MDYRRVGNSGLRVSVICLGAWINFGERIEDGQTFAVLDTALEEGIDFFDTADVYASGKALAWLLHQPGMVSPIIGATRPEQVRENARAASIKLTSDNLNQIEEILKPKSNA